MTKAIIIEDEELQARQLIKQLHEVCPDLHIEEVITSVADGIAFLKSEKSGSIDIIFSDVNLTDGVCFEIFNKVKVNVPVVFTTEYDKFLLDVFNYKQMAYVVKPIRKLALHTTLNKLTKHQEPLKKENNGVFSGGKKRLLVNKRREVYCLLLQDIILFYSRNKTVQVLDKEGKWYFSEKSLTELDLILDPDIFFRANRQYILNINYIKSFCTHEKNKIQVNIEHYSTPVIVSQDSASSFRNWMQNA
jgi:DNA-binding LytR/AlgR family response regulator